jgi:hypothetical protein
MDVVYVDWQSVYLCFGGQIDYAVAGSPTSALPVKVGWRRRLGRQASNASAASKTSSTRGQRLSPSPRLVEATNGVDTTQPAASGTKSRR